VSFIGCDLLACMDFKVLYARQSPTTYSVTSGNQCTWTKLFRHCCSTCKTPGVIVINFSSTDGLLLFGENGDADE